MTMYGPEPPNARDQLEPSLGLVRFDAVHPKGPLGFKAHCLCCLEREAADKNRQPPKQRLLGALQEVVAPPDRCPEGLLPRREISRSSSHKWQAVLDPVQHCRRRQ